MQTTRVERHAAPLRQRVVRQLREDILDGRLAAGERLRESALCAAYEVSRTVVREALRQLESENLITVLPNRGPIVTVLSRHDIEALYEVRRALEGLAGELFAIKATAAQTDAIREHLAHMESDYLHGDVESRERSKARFYELLCAGADNEVLADSLRSVHTRIGRFRHYAFVDDERVAQSMDELRRIVVAATELRDPAAARRACENHIREAGELAVVEYAKRLDDGVAPDRRKRSG